MDAWVDGDICLNKNLHLQDDIVTITCMSKTNLTDRKKIRKIA